MISMEKIVRLAGLLATFVGSFLYLIGTSFVHWARTDSSYYGLWQYCSNNSTTLNESLSISSEENDQDEDDDNCEVFSISDIPGSFHIVRALVVISIICLVYGILFSNTFHIHIRRRSSLMSTHRGELACLIGAIAGFSALFIFNLNYQSYDFGFISGDDEPRLDWCVRMCNTNAIIVICGSLCMLAPTIHMKLSYWKYRFHQCCGDQVDACHKLLFCWRRQDPPRTDPRPDAVIHDGSDFLSIDIQINESNVSTDVDSIYTLDNSSQNPARLQDASSYSDPAPRYEDLSPSVPPPSFSEVVSPQDRLGLPPPPSYNEVLTPREQIEPTSPSSFNQDFSSREGEELSSPPSYNEALAPTGEVEPLPPPSYYETLSRNYTASATANFNTTESLPQRQETSI